MTLNKALGTALKQVRNAAGLTQEDFSQVSSRTYMSTLERGLKSPTLEKLDQIAQVMGVHPLTILVLAYSRMEKKENTNKLLKEIQCEIDNHIN
ncbi:MAG: helix-turn-helix domain-containing protein [Gammaproteobacteria bacterium]|nr:helix-turn-helix domain-containing protein [Gammaproteobacteria bacterium]